MIIAQISDTHIALDTEDCEQRIRDFEAVVSDINNLNPQPDLIVHTGDIVHNGRAGEYKAATDILSKAKAPVVAIPGNKDKRPEMRAAFDSFGFLRSESSFIDFSIEDYPVRLLFLDTLDPGGNKGSFCEERLNNFNGLIAADRSKPILVFAHHPPFEVTVGPDPMHFGDECEMEGFGRPCSVQIKSLASFAGMFTAPIRALSATSLPLFPLPFPPHFARASIIRGWRVHQSTKSCAMIRRMDFLLKLELFSQYILIEKLIKPSVFQQSSANAGSSANAEPL